MTRPPTKAMIYRMLAEQYQFTPRQIAEMTPAQQLIFFRDDRPQKKKFSSLADALAYNARQKQQSVS